MRWSTLSTASLPPGLGAECRHHAGVHILGEVDVGTGRLAWAIAPVLDEGDLRQEPAELGDPGEVTEKEILAQL
jgi:hypothetical protein